jgi:hypothetical protein
VPVVDEHVAAFYVDVNSASDSGKVGTTRHAAVDGYGPPGRAQVGVYVWAVDSDDNACTALVTAVDGEWIELHLDESTWVPLESVVAEKPLGRDERVSFYPMKGDDVLRKLLRSPVTGRYQNKSAAKRMPGKRPKDPGKG